MFKDKCKAPGKTLYVCAKCKSRFHHLCSSSDEPNICREDCNGVPPSDKVDAKTKLKANLPTSTANVFMTEDSGVDLTGVDDSDDDDQLLQKANQILSQQANSSVTSRAMALGFKNVGKRCRTFLEVTCLLYVVRTFWRES